MNTTTEQQTQLDNLKTLRPCSEGLDYALSKPSLFQAWEDCQKSQWMWWYINKRKLYTKELCITYSKQCAEHVKHLKQADAAVAATAAYAYADAAAAAAYAYAADADAYAYAVAAAAYAYAADADAVAAAIAYAAERLWQANLLRTLVPNPFLLVATEGEK